MADCKKFKVSGLAGLRRYNVHNIRVQYFVKDLLVQIAHTDRANWYHDPAYSL
jgi:hypothetical protein